MLNLSVLSRTLRTQQWAKNFLVFLPIVVSHRVFYPALFVKTIAVFFIFCASTSSVYVINDILDVEYDKHHPKKKNRPIASGEITSTQAICLVLPLALLALICSAFFPYEVFVTILTYFILAISYSLYLKKQLVIDVMAVAVFYFLRIAAGAFAIKVVLSDWLLAFSLFFALSLGIAKRYAELELYAQSTQIAKGRAYRIEDQPVLVIAGMICGYLSLLVVTLYINSDTASELYRNPKILWLGGFLLFYWITRFWMLTVRSEMQQDPIYFITRDKNTYAVGLLLLVVFLLAI